MNEFGIINLSRRDFLKAGAGLTLGIAVPSLAQMAGPGQGGGRVVAAGTFEPNAFVRIGTDNTVTVIVKHLEMGQGTYTGLPTLVAEELDADWGQIRVEAALRTQAATTIFSWARFRVPAAAQRSQIRTSRCAKPAPQRGRCCSPLRPSAGMSRRIRSRSRAAR